MIPLTAEEQRYRALALPLRKRLRERAGLPEFEPPTVTTPGVKELYLRGCAFLRADVMEQILKYPGTVTVCTGQRVTITVAGDANAAAAYFLEHLTPFRVYAGPTPESRRILTLPD